MALKKKLTKKEIETFNIAFEEYTKKYNDMFNEKYGSLRKDN